MPVCAASLRNLVRNAGYLARTLPSSVPRSLSQNSLFKRNPVSIAWTSTWTWTILFDVRFANVILHPDRVDIAPDFPAQPMLFVIKI
jgi:hypothetical protein